MRIVGQNSDVHFGEVDEEEPDWREELEEETDPDDEELEYTPQDVIDILGFDPKEFSEPEPTSNESNPMSLNTTKALLIINAKKGWSDTARVKAAATRKRKMKFSQFKEKTLAAAQKKANKLFTEAQKLRDKGMKLIHDSNQVWGSKSDNLYKKADRTMRQGDTALYQAESLDRRVKKIRSRNSPISNAKKGVKNPKMKGWTDEARKKAALTRKAKSKILKGKSGETARKKVVKKGMSEAASKRMDKIRAKSQVDRSKVQAMDENQLQGILASRGRNPLKMYAQHEMKKRGIAVSKRR